MSNAPKPDPEFWYLASIAVALFTLGWLVFQ